MTRSRALLALCLIVVAAAATLFPAAGLGTHPGGSLPADARPATASAAPASPTAATAGSATATESTGTERGTPTASPTPSPTSAPTDTPTPTDAAAGGDETGGLLALFALPPLVTLFVLPPAVALLAALGFLAGRTEPDGGAGEGGASPFWGSFAALPRATMTALVRGSTRLGAVLSGAGRAATGVLGGVGSALGGISLPSLGLPDRSGRAGDAASAVGSVLHSSRDAEAEETVVPAESEPDEREPPASVYEAWAALTAEVSPPQLAVRTPGEVARAAVAAGYPADAVRRLTRAFREVRYGGRPDEGRLDGARDALARIRGEER